MITWEEEYFGPPLSVPKGNIVIVILPFTIWKYNSSQSFRYLELQNPSTLGGTGGGAVAGIHFYRIRYTDREKFNSLYPLLKYPDLICCS